MKLKSFSITFLSIFLSSCFPPPADPRLFSMVAKLRWATNKNWDVRKKQCNLSLLCSQLLRVELSVTMKDHHSRPLRRINQSARVLRERTNHKRRFSMCFLQYILPKQLHKRYNPIPYKIIINYGTISFAHHRDLIFCYQYPTMF